MEKAEIPRLSKAGLIHGANQPAIYKPFLPLPRNETGLEWLPRAPFSIYYLVSCFRNWDPAIPLVPCRSSWVWWGCTVGGLGWTPRPGQHDWSVWSCKRVLGMCLLWSLAYARFVQCFPPAEQIRRCCQWLFIPVLFQLPQQFHRFPPYLLLLCWIHRERDPLHRYVQQRQGEINGRKLPEQRSLKSFYSQTSTMNSARPW